MGTAIGIYNLLALLWTRPTNVFQSKKNVRWKIEMRHENPGGAPGAEPQVAAPTDYKFRLQVHATATPGPVIPTH